MLVPTKIDLTVDAERHKTFKVPPFLQALEHSSDCERSSQRVEKKSSISSIKNTGKAQTPSPPNGHARFWVNEEIWARSLKSSRKFACFSGSVEALRIVLSMASAFSELNL